MAALRRDWLGSELADFERALLFDEDKRHWGWFQWAPDGGSRLFTLSKSPFLGQVGIPVYYLIEDNIGSLPSENQFIRVEVNGPPHEESYPARYKLYTVKEIRPVSDKELINILPRPRLYIDEFRHQSTINFDGAEKDNLDLMLPLQLVSCPGNEYGRGGLIVLRESFLENNKKTGYRPVKGDQDVVRQFKQGVIEQVPAGFRETNPAYMYKIIAPGKEKEINSLQKKVREVNVMADPGTALKIHFPLLHLQSRYHYRQPLSSDVVSYQLTALICQPYVRTEDLKMVEQVILNARKRIERFDSGPGLTPWAEIKITEAFARLRLVQNNSIYRFLGDASKLVETQMKLREDLYHDFLASQMDAYADLLSAFDGMELKGVSVGGKKRAVNLSKFDASLSRSDISVYLEIRRMLQESGDQYVKRKDLRTSLGTDAAKLTESLNTLRNRGYIIMVKNGTLIKLFDLGEFSDRFDEGLKK